MEFMPYKKRKKHKISLFLSLSLSFSLFISHNVRKEPEGGKSSANQEECFCIWGTKYTYVKHWGLGTQNVWMWNPSPDTLCYLGEIIYPLEVYFLISKVGLSNALWSSYEIEWDNSHKVIDNNNAIVRGWCYSWGDFMWREKDVVPTVEDFMTRMSYFLA